MWKVLAFCAFVVSTILYALKKDAAGAMLSGGLALLTFPG